MKTSLLYLIVILFTSHTYAQSNIERSWGTYLGDERFSYGDSCIDSAGNLYVVGTVNGSDLTNIFPFTNPTAHQPSYGGGTTDGFIMKLNPSGELVWGTFFGNFLQKGILWFHY